MLKPRTMAELASIGIGTREDWVAGSVEIGMNGQLAGYAWDVMESLFELRDRSPEKAAAVDPVLRKLQDSETDVDLLLILTPAQLLLDVDFSTPTL